jgi:L-seryl-tRNA(Ser) seleniumtransferase
MIKFESMKKSLLRNLPSVDEVLNDEELKGALTRYSHGIVTDIVRVVIEAIRGEIISGKRETVSRGEISGAVLEKLRAISAPRVVRVINATGTVLHTNLGRAVLSTEAIKGLSFACEGPVNLEFDLKSASRGDRDNHVEELLKLLTGAEAACVVNNNAAAVLIVLNTFAEGKEVIISRGELVEIGGSFRLPEVIKKSGCILREVGTTNRTHPEDYTSAINRDTALLLKAHKSNYEVVGFTSEVPLRELVSIGNERGLPVVEDLGSGALVDLSNYGIMKEPVVCERVAQGADVVTFSGDKLLGGPQAGLMVGKKEFIDKIKKNPLKRALRVDKLTLSALEATLRLYLDPGSLPEKLPTLRYLARPIEEIEAIAREAKKALEKRLGSGYTLNVEEGLSQVGSGALPGHGIPTKLLTVTHGSIKPEAIFRRFLENNPPILGRVKNEKFILDLRTIDRAEDVVPVR